MATLNEVPAQLNAWIDELNGEIGRLADRRKKFVELLASLGEAVAAPAATPKSAPAPKPKTDAAERRAADAERKRRARAKSQPRTGGSKYDYVEVARIANAAKRAGEPMGPAVAARFKVQPTMGAWLVSEARKRGLDVPGNKPRVAATSNVTSIVKDAAATTAHPAAGRAFTPDDALRIIEGG